jgi:VIT1/CCC1 family predicted Fe2+/Mn2+ transporter
MIHLSLSGYFTKVLLRCMGVLIIALPLPLILLYFLSDTFINSIMVCLSGLLAMLFSSYVIGLVSNERKFIKDKILLFLKL